MSAMTDLERAALEIRRRAATSALAAGEVDGPAALLLIVLPPPDLRDASLAAAQAQLDERRVAA